MYVGGMYCHCEVGMYVGGMYCHSEVGMYMHVTVCDVAYTSCVSIQIYVRNCFIYEKSV